MDCKKVNLIFNINDYGTIFRLSSMDDSELVADEFISMKDMRQASFKCSGCQLKICVRIAFRFPYKEELTEGKVIKICHAKPEEALVAEQVVVLPFPGNTVDLTVEEQPPAKRAREETIEEVPKVQLQQLVKKITLPNVVAVNGIPMTGPWVKIPNSKGDSKKMQKPSTNISDVVQNVVDVVKHKNSILKDCLTRLSQIGVKVKDKSGFDVASCIVQKKLSAVNAKIYDFGILNAEKKIPKSLALIAPEENLTVAEKLAVMNTQEEVKKIPENVTVEKVSVASNLPEDDDDEMIVEALESDVEELLNDEPFPEPSDESEEESVDERIRPWWDPYIEAKFVPKDRCPICLEKFPIQLSIHMSENHPKYIGSICEICGKHFSERGKLFSAHIEKHFPSTGTFPCKNCNKKEFSYRLDEMNHRKNCVKDPIPKIKERKPTVKKTCEICGLGFFKLPEHMAIVHENRPVFRCDECPFETIRPNSLRLHMVTKHGSEEERQFECDVCQKRFSIKSTLLQHRKVHSEMRFFTCDQCGRSYKHKQDLLNHMNVHTGAMPFACRFCGRKFQDRGNKNGHQRRVHAKEIEKEMLNKPLD